MSEPTNPFGITKAVDLSDQDIERYWVDITEGGFRTMMNPCSPMPMLILGGKGSGKTHLMRYFSYPLQKLRSNGSVLDSVLNDGYVGIYLLSSGLNAARFAGKEQNEAKWSSVFAHHMDLSLARLTLATVIDMFSGSDQLSDAEAEICADVGKLLYLDGLEPPGTLQDVVRILSDYQKNADEAIDNCTITRSLDLKIHSKPGALVFGIPEAILRHVPKLDRMEFVYLIDELENLSEYQQRYVNTLIREKRPPCTFRIGARLYGIKTYCTLTEGEINREGSEFELLQLDDHLRNSKSYPDFAHRLMEKRLVEQGYATPHDSLRWLDKMFQDAPSLSALVKKYDDSERPYFTALRKHLSANLKGLAPLGVLTELDVDNIIRSLAYQPDPLVEKVNIYLFYKVWSSKVNLVEAAKRIGKDGARYATGAGEIEDHQDTYEHFKKDLEAQLFRDCRTPQRYVGLDTFIDMSSGLPRSFLVILKHIFGWALFNGENPSTGSPVSVDAQRKGVLEATAWFWDDAAPSGSDGGFVKEAVERLAELFKTIRFSHKPTECSPCTFSADISRATQRARGILKQGTECSLLLRIPGGQKDRNSMRVDEKYQINPMLAPRWDLPVARRGTVPLSPDEANAIFDPDLSGDFKSHLNRRKRRLNAPFLNGGDSEEQVVLGYD